MIGSAPQIRRGITHRVHRLVLPLVVPHHLLHGHLQVALHLLVHHHRALERDQIKIAAVRICRQEADRAIAVVQLATLAMVVKSVIHAGFALLRKIVINRVFVRESLNLIFLKM
jgi:hypothetical protein